MRSFHRFIQEEIMRKMTPRERVLTALNHEEPDRVPLDIGGGSSTTILVEAYQNLLDHLEFQTKPKIMSELFRLVWVDEVLLKSFGSDFRSITTKGPAHWKPPVSKPDTYIDIWGITWKKVRYSEKNYYWEMIEHPLANASVEDLEQYPWPDPNDPGYYVGLAEEAQALYSGTDYAIVGSCGFSNFWETAYMLRGLMQMLRDLVSNQDFVSALLSKLLEINLLGTARFLDAAAPHIQVFRASDDLATQQGLFMSPKTFRNLFKPVYKRYFDFVKSKTDAKIFFHSCGNVTNLIDDLVDMGVDALNPVQVSAMPDTALLKANYGDKITFWGGIDTQYVLPQGSVEEVVAEVRKRIRDLAPGGGFIAASVHNIQPDVPPQNILAMIDAVHTFGKYPIEA